MVLYLALREDSVFRVVLRKGKEGDNKREAQAFPCLVPVHYHPVDHCLPNLAVTLPKSQ